MRRAAGVVARHTRRPASPRNAANRALVTAKIRMRFWLMRTNAPVFSDFVCHCFHSTLSQILHRICDNELRFGCDRHFVWMLALVCGRRAQRRRRTADGSRRHCDTSGCRLVTSARSGGGRRSEMKRRPVRRLGARWSRRLASRPRWRNTRINAGYSP